MDLIGVIIAGLVGTAVMTVLMYMAPAMGMLGTMLTENPGSGP